MFTLLRSASDASSTPTPNPTPTLNGWTLGTLKTRLANWSERNDVADFVQDFVDYAHQEICRTLRGTVNLVTADLTVDTEFIDQPAYFRAMKRLYLTTPHRLELRAVSADTRVDMTVRYPSCAYPSSYSVENDVLGFAPLFTGTTTGKALYYAEPAPMFVDLDTNVVLRKYPFMYLYGALSELFRFIEDDNNANIYETRFRGMISDCNASEAKDATSGPLKPIASSSAVI